MIKKNIKILTITSIVVLLPILVGAALWSKLPSEIPNHWNASGEVDGYASKPFAVFGMPMIMLALHWVAALVTSVDPKHKNHPTKILHLVFWLIPVISVIVSAFTYSAALGSDLKIEVILPVFLGLVFVLVGNYMPKCRQNYTIGIKLPWTLDSEENWNRTHRLAGKVWVAGGLVIMISGFFGSVVLLTVAALIMVIIPIVYSYVLHRKGK